MADGIDVRIHGLSKHFNQVRAVDDLTFDVPAGTVTGFLGPNGSGKTTTLRMLLGLSRPTAGSALIGGRAYADLAEPRRTVGAVLETAGFHPGRRGRDHLRIVAQAARIPRRRVDEVLGEVGLEDAASRRVGGYSLGMRQRLGLAAALLGRPRLLVLDEPANGLDPAGMAWLRELIAAQAAAGHTVVVSSHVLAEVARIADHVVIVNAGRLRFAGPTAAMTKTLEETFTDVTQ
ncbi:ATP-binding cassette domain-containing protein [Dactylosporangium sp. NPDC049525]|uniref:ABC transporter ATP-binding protein n=1 Tax=Dactylosporangium sp. NPDC049525 TaxID=3154730 RepID=UPI003449DFAE